jgi:hypothetical protein
MSRRWAWTICWFGVLVSIVGAFLLYTTWNYDHYGVYLRTYSGESEFEIQWGIASYLLLHDHDMQFTLGISLIGAVVAAVGWDQTGREK